MVASLRKHLLFCVGVGVTGYAYARLMIDSALMTSHWSANHVPAAFSLILTTLMLCALAGTILLSATSWWWSVYRGHSVALLAMLVTGVIAFRVIEQVMAEQLAMTWTMLPLLMTVLLASAGTVFALRRRSDHDSCSLPTGKGQENNESSCRR